MQPFVKSHNHRCWRCLLNNLGRGTSEFFHISTQFHNGVALSYTKEQITEIVFYFLELAGINLHLLLVQF